MHTSAGWGERPDREHYHRTTDGGGATRPPQERRSPSATTLEILIEGDAASGVACADDGRGFVEIIYIMVCPADRSGIGGDYIY